MRRATTVLAFALLAVGCDDDTQATRSTTPPPSFSPPIDPATRYASMCASCHGEVGEGGFGTRLVDTPSSVAALTRAIDQRMPQGNPGACRGECASSLAVYIKENFTTAALSCDVIAPSPRSLRLLTRREYRNTLRDLLGLAGAPSTTSTPPSTAVDCYRRRFAWAPGARMLRSVNLAGSFNGWSPTATPLTRAEATGEWETTLTLANGSHQYKFVLDGTEWVRDPRNPDTAPDGFGGQNSLLNVTCMTTPVTPMPAAGRTLGFDPAAMLPVESRPQGVAFDTAWESAVVSPTHVSEHLRVAAAITDALRSDLRAVVGCTAAMDAASCAGQVTGAFGRRVFRRPLTEGEAQRYRALVMGASSVDAGVARALRAMLVSPNFLYRSEMGAAQSDGTYRLTPWELAASLSYTFWGTTPDDALLDAAARGALDTPADIEREARRLLGDARAREQLAAFATQWFGVESVATTPRNATLFPDFTDAVRTSMLEETRRFFTAVVLDGTHTLTELYTSNESFVDETLARYYGMSGVTGADFRRVRVPDARGGGVLAHGSVLTRYAHSDQSSPILRGVFVRQALLCQQFPPPPANAGGVPDVNPGATTRERFRQHTANAVCATCHTHIDGIGFGFEQFDAVGRVRDTENGMPIDHAGNVDDLEGFGRGTNTTFSSPAELGRALATSEAASVCAARQWYRFARGFRETAAQRCAVRSLAARMRDRGGDLRELMVGATLSPDFLYRR